MNCFELNFSSCLINIWSKGEKFSLNQLNWLLILIEAAVSFWIHRLNFSLSKLLKSHKQLECTNCSQISEIWFIIIYSALMDLSKMGCFPFFQAKVAAIKLSMIRRWVANKKKQFMFNSQDPDICVSNFDQ